VIGVGVDSFVPGRPDHAQKVRIINNTIAWNAIGVWSGNTRMQPPNNISENVLLLLNNIFDSGSPSYALAGLSGFEGVSTEEREVASRGLVPNIHYFAPPVDTNAWEPARVNQQVAAPPNWPATRPRFFGGSPVVDITQFTNSVPARAGCLYVNDIFDAAWTGGYSPHDFRLAPMVTNNRSIPPSVLNLLNPLVNVGIGPIPNLSSFPITMVSADFIDQEPGLPNGSEGRTGSTNFTPVHGWDYDGEGFGNPRNQPRANFPANPDPWLGEMDVGADEMGQYIIAGFFNGTRILSPDPVPNAPLAPPHGLIFFFDLPGPQWRPVCNIYPAGYPYWFDHVQGTVDAEVNNYTAAITIGSTTPGQLATRTALFGFGWNPFMRGLECDFTPHLVPDLHPFWGSSMGDLVAVPSPLSNDIYATNPWYNDPAQAPSPPFVSRRRFDNPALFHNFHIPLYTASTSWVQLGAPMYVRDATLNPPGTYPLGTPWTTGTVGPWTLFPNQLLGPYAPCGGTSALTYSVGPWGFGDSPASCPDVVPGIATGGGTLLVSALRFNCEWYQTNLQTFLGIRTPAPVGGLGEMGRSFQQTSGATVRRTLPPTREELREVVQRVMERE